VNGAYQNGDCGKGVTDLKGFFEIGGTFLRTKRKYILSSILKIKSVYIFKLGNIHNILI